MNTEDLESVRKELEQELLRLEQDEQKQNTENIEPPKIENQHVNNQPKKVSWFKKMPLWTKVVSIVFSLVLVIGLGSVIYIYSMLNKLNHENPEEIITQEEIFDVDELDPDIEVVNPEDIDISNVNNIDGPRLDSNVINILLLGEENIEGGVRGRSDAIIIASINKKQKALKLTSIMRDTYVQIPGYKDNKINSSYGSGGAPLLIETIEKNFDIKIDGYALVNFTSFETLIDKLGGVDIKLTGAEARYLNRTNYISNPAYRNVVEGLQTLNGNQALGYARVRHVGNSDFERTNRHQKVITALFNKYKSSSITKMVETVNYIIPQIKTNMLTNDIISYATTVLTLGATEIETFRIPVDNGYQDKYVRTMRVLVPDIKLNTDELHKFIYGEEEITADNATEEIIVNQ